MLRDVLRKVIATVASDVLTAIVAVAVNVVLSSEDVLSFRDRDIQMDRGPIGGQSDPLRVDPSVVHEPRVHSIDRILGGAEGLDDLLGRPVSPIVWRLRVCDFQQVVIQLV